MPDPQARRCFRCPTLGLLRPVLFFTMVTHSNRPPPVFLPSRRSRSRILDSIHSDGGAEAAAEIARGTFGGVVDHGDPVLSLGVVSQGEGRCCLSSSFYARRAPRSRPGVFGSWPTAAMAVCWDWSFTIYCRAEFFWFSTALDR